MNLVNRRIDGQTDRKIDLGTFFIKETFFKSYITHFQVPWMHDEPIRYNLWIFPMIIIDFSWMWYTFQIPALWRHRKETLTFKVTLYDEILFQWWGECFPPGHQMSLQFLGASPIRAVPKQLFLCMYEDTHSLERVTVAFEARGSGS